MLNRLVLFLTVLIGCAFVVKSCNKFPEEKALSKTVAPAGDASRGLGDY